VRRLYSTFAGGWPGIGLLLMRLVLGASLFVSASSTMWGNPLTLATVRLSLLGAFGLLLITGLCTPIAGASVAVLETWQIVTVTDGQWVALLLGTIAGALAMLGPGLWSIDARLFGWKRIEISRRDIPMSPKKAAPPTTKIRLR
jgi:putative oxidoreductase